MGKLGFLLVLPQSVICPEIPGSDVVVLVS